MTFVPLWALLAVGAGAGAAPEGSSVEGVWLSQGYGYLIEARALKVLGAE